MHNLRNQPQLQLFLLCVCMLFFSPAFRAALVLAYSQCQMLGNNNFPVLLVDLLSNDILDAIAIEYVG